MSHLGIRLRISVPAGVLLDADSDYLHYISRYSGYGEDWYDIIGGRDMSLTIAPDLKVEIKAVTLAEYVPDDDESEDKPESDLDHCGCPCSNCSGCLG
jgi:hypothetical protein